MTKKHLTDEEKVQLILEGHCPYCFHPPAQNVRRKEHYDGCEVIINIIRNEIQKLAFDDRK
jgi:ribosomal protein S6E (S10)